MILSRMKLNKPKFWKDKINFISIFLYPLSLIFILVVHLKKIFTRDIEFKIPIICIGNIYLGGTGKTPACIFLANEFLKIGKKVAIVRKFYVSHEDEHGLIKENFSNLILNKERIQGVIEAEKSGLDCIILDDGFQDFSIKKNLNILCFHQNQLIGNGLVLPAGPLRESLNSLKRAHCILINGKKNESFEKKILNINKDLKIFYSSYKPQNLEQFRNKKLLAVAGIGNPENFFQLIEENNLKIAEKLIFPDHHIFSQIEIDSIKNKLKSSGYQIITTEKDYFKMKHFDIKKLNYLKISLEISDKEKFIKMAKGVFSEKT